MNVDEKIGFGFGPDWLKKIMFVLIGLARCATLMQCSKWPKKNVACAQSAQVYRRPGTLLAKSSILGRWYGTKWPKSVVPLAQPMRTLARMV